MEAGKIILKERKEKISCVAEVKLKYAIETDINSLPKVTQASDAFKILRDNWDNDSICFYETFKVLLLNKANRVIGSFTASTGGMTGTVVDPKIIFMAALTTGAGAIILCHNHPSGNLKPSQSDILVTKRLVEGGKLLEIPVLDHLIINASEDRYYSFADNNMI